MKIEKYEIVRLDISANFIIQMIKGQNVEYAAVCGVPRGGIPLAMRISDMLQIPLISMEELENLYRSDVENVLICDDIIDSGATRSKFSHLDFAAIYINDDWLNQGQSESISARTFYHLGKDHDTWINFFWEGNEKPATDAVTRLIQMIGDNPNREGLVETPKRFIKAYEHIFSGYNQDINSILKTFEEEECDEIILLKNVEFYSMCEHHMLPFIGKAHIAYIPDGKVLGVSKLARILDVFARRLQIQERIGKQITNVLMDDLGAKGAACILEAQHLCMTMRGVEKQNSIMTTSSMQGVFRGMSVENLAARNELMSLIKE